MVWLESHDEIFIREVRLYEPWNFRHGSVELGLVWKRIPKALKKMKEPKFKVDDRSVRDHYRILEKKFKRKENNKEKPSGINPPEETELEQGLRDCIEAGEDMRQSSLETFSQTRKRRGEDSSDDKKSRWSLDDLVSFLRERSGKESELRKAELKERKQANDRIYNLIAQQQQQLQQQTLQTLFMLQLMQKPP